MKNILITGAAGEVGYELISFLSNPSSNLITLDLKKLPTKLNRLVVKHHKGSILNATLINKIINHYRIDTIFHLAAILSASAEKNPDAAHKVNVQGTYTLLSESFKYAQKRKKGIKFMFPSSIAVYGMPSLQAKKTNTKIKEDNFLNPITIYGVNKLYCENLGIYFSKYYNLFDKRKKYKLDFRCVRYPGLISSNTMPTGGTSDYAPEMLHHACRGKPYKCFVRPDSEIPFMAMPDAVNAIIKLSKAPSSKLTKSVYNVSGFSATADQIKIIIENSFPKAKITYKINKERQKIIDSWPADINDSSARKDWGWKPKFNFEETFLNYLIPSLNKRVEKVN